jgi:glycogen debranching enzyme
LDSLWRRRLRDGLLVIVHPWESGADDSPRWDSWVGSTRWRRRRWTHFDRWVLESTVFADGGEAVENRVFVAAPAAFNAIAADAAATLGTLLGDESWLARGRELADALDATAWDDTTGLWADIAFTGGGPSVRVPTLDGVLPALCTADAAKSARALDQLNDPRRFGGPFGPRYLCPDDDLYRPNRYWRGSCWPQLSYLCVLAALRWNRYDIAARIASSAAAGVCRSRFSEYWNPETGRGHGARPQTWAALVVAASALVDHAEVKQP